MLAALVALHLPAVSPTEPNRQPQLAAAGGTVALVFGSGETIWLARSLDNGRNFVAPSKVAQLPKMLLGRHRGPRVALSGDTIVVSAIASEPGDLMAWRSTDRGRTWSAPIAINDTPKAAREGLHAMVSDAEGHMAAAWLDDRDGKGKRLYGAFSNDAGRSWSRNVLLYESPDGTICQCCDPSLAVIGNGEFAVMWRNALGWIARSLHPAPAGRPSSGPRREAGRRHLETGRLPDGWRRPRRARRPDRQCLAPRARYLSRRARQTRSQGRQRAGRGTRRQLPGTLCRVEHAFRHCTARSGRAPRRRSFRTPAPSPRSSRSQMAPCWWPGKKTEPSPPPAFSLPFSRSPPPWSTNSLCRVESHSTPALH